jgi:hypothetical protein
MMGILSPVMAGMIHILHTGGILLNSGRLLSWEAPVEPMDRCRKCTQRCTPDDKRPVITVEAVDNCSGK